MAEFLQSEARLRTRLKASARARNDKQAIVRMRRSATRSERATLDGNQSVRKSKLESVLQVVLLVVRPRRLRPPSHLSSIGAASHLAVVVFMVTSER